MSTSCRSCGDHVEKKRAAPCWPPGAQRIPGLAWPFDGAGDGGARARSEGPLGGTRTPSLLIRRLCHPCLLPAHSPLTCRNAAHWCAVDGSVERPCAAKCGQGSLGDGHQPHLPSTVTLPCQ